ncbi:hypothetical protein FFLO_06215 [Filobasidium floriforme]|uniref:DUF7029 domain-containing protein n=1 Tax=Filobasidium floriforme TaxID=5210 RepID=A0A8K0JHP2_9TREE|nr:hypothetical protein FFLO_06215 [Filobasidium floriforme]
MRSTTALLLVSLARLCQLAPVIAAPYAIQPIFQSDFSQGNIEDDFGHVTTLYVPAAPLNWDATDVSHLRPAKDGFLYFTLDGSSDPAAKHSYILLENTYNHPTVILDHSVYPSVRSCHDNELVIEFSSPAAFKVAAESWSRGSTLVTHSAGCASTNQATKHSYWSVVHTKSDARSRCVKIQVRSIDVDQAIEATDVSWGSYSPVSQGHLRQRTMGSDDATLTGVLIDDLDPLR